MDIAIFQFSLFGINTYVVSDPETNECLIVDPGMSTQEEVDALTNYVDNSGLKPTGIVNTHLHLDHAVGNDALVRLYDIPVMANIRDLPLGERMEQQARMFGIIRSFPNVVVTRYLLVEDIIKVGNGELKVLEVPGHSPGSVALYDKKDNFVITGDALFQGSIGRTDLTGGDYDTLIESITKNLLSLPDSTIVYPGHGNPTTIGEEKKFNPYLSRHI